LLKQPADDFAGNQQPRSISGDILSTEDVLTLEFFDQRLPNGVDIHKTPIASAWRARKARACIASGNPSIASAISAGCTGTKKMASLASQFLFQQRCGERH